VSGDARCLLEIERAGGVGPGVKRRGKKERGWRKIIGQTEKNRKGDRGIGRPGPEDPFREGGQAVGGRGFFGGRAENPWGIPTAPEELGKKGLN